MSTKPVVHIGHTYQFHNSDDDVSVVSTLTAVTDTFHTKEGFWNYLLAQGEWRSPREVYCEILGNEDSESIRSAETIQSLREENAKLVERIQKLEIAVDILETAMISTGHEALLQKLQGVVKRFHDRKTGGAK